MLARVLCYLWLVSIIWSASFGLIGHFLDGVPASWLTLVRLLLALFLFALWFRPKGLRAKKLGTLAGLGAIQYGLMYLLLFRSFLALPGQSYLIALFTITTPIYVVLFNDWMKRRWSSSAWVSIALAITGAAVIQWPWGRDTVWGTQFWLGFLLIQGSNAAFAFGQVAYRKIRSEWPEKKDAEIYAPIYLGAVVCALFAVGSTGQWSPGRDFDAVQIGVILFLGFVASGLAFFWWNKGATLVHAETLAIMNNVKVPLAVAVSLLIFREYELLRPVSFAAGTTLIIAALLLARHHEHPRPSKN